MKIEARVNKKAIVNDVGGVVYALLVAGAHGATMYLDPTHIVRATRSKISSKTQTTVILTIGRPNFAERLAIKQFKKAGEPFPVKKIQLKFRRKR